MTFSYSHIKQTGNWDEVLTQVEETLANALAEVNRRESALEDFIQASKTDDSHAPWPQMLESHAQGRNRLRELADGAGQSVAEVDAALGAGEEHLRLWLERTSEAQAKLAKWRNGANGGEPAAEKPAKMTDDTIPSSQ